MAVTANISMLLRYGLTVIGGIAILFYTSWRLTVVMLSIVLSGRAGAVIYGRMLRALAGQVRTRWPAPPRSAEETFSGIRTVARLRPRRARIGRYWHRRPKPR